MRPFRFPPLPPDATALLFSDPPARIRPPPLDAPDPSPGGIGWEVYSVQRARRRGRLWLLGLLVALAVHGAVATAALRSRAGDRAPRAPEPLVMFEYEVELEVEPERPEPPPPDSTPEPARRRARRLPRAPKASPSSASPPEAEPARGPPPPAQAGQVLAIEAEVAPLDFTAFEITSGDAPRYAGGTTASAGTNSEAVHTPVVDPDARPGRRDGRVDLTRPVSLPAPNWKCPWPDQAEALGIDEQIVVLRAVVRANGEVASVEVLADPGYGFGEAARACALEARFRPARDRAGTTFAATSPPIRVRFTR